jgi:hypothetical protein
MAQTNHINIVVQATPGQSSEDIGKSVFQKFQDSLPGGFSVTGGQAFDVPDY